MTARPVGRTESFRDGRAHTWQSNFYPDPVEFRGVLLNSGEAAYAYAKTDDPDAQSRIARTRTPGEAKREGRRAPLRTTPKLWDAGEKYRAMDEVIAAKFTPGSRLAELLLGTEDDLLVEGNSWGDNDFGDADNTSWPGKNALGRSLMRRRAELRGDADTYWPIVCATGHRPKDVPSGMEGWIRDRLSDVAARLRDEHGTRVAVTGMAMGVDLWWADAAYGAGLDVWCYIPFDAQVDDRWPDSWVDFYDSIREDATWSGSLDRSFDVKLLHARNDWMLRDSAALVAVWRPSRTVRSGTMSCLNKATRMGMPVLHVNPEDETVTDVPGDRSKLVW